MTKGDIVYLKSGSPPLEILRVFNSKALCLYKDSSEKERLHEFVLLCLCEEKPWNEEI